jgi:cytidylate kinase
MNDIEKEQISVEEFVNRQIDKWKKIYPASTKKRKVEIPVITVAMEPGAGGCWIAEKVAQRLDFDFFHSDMVNKIAESARISEAVVDSLEKERMSGVQDFIASVIKDQYIHPSIYLEHLMKVVGIIGKHGRAVIVGRGANFIIPPADRFAVRVVAPLEVRIENVAHHFRVPSETAKRRVLVRESRRGAFVRQSFNADIADPVHYDMMINTQYITIDAAVEAIIGGVMGRVGAVKKTL